MGKKKPKAPDPRQTAAAQTGTNVDTAVASAFLSNVNQVDPNGTLSFDVTGEYDWRNAYTGQTYKIPTFTATQSLNEQGQELKGIHDQSDINLATMARDQSAKVNDLLGNPMTLGNEATEARLFELGSARLDPMFARDEETIRQRLSDQGIKAGSEGFDRALNRFDERKNDAYNQLLLQGRGQSVQEGLTERNQPLNEITALMSGSQVSQPNFLNTAERKIANTDVAGIIQDDFNNRFRNAQVQNEAKGEVAGGLFQLGAGAMMMSDRRIKRDIRRIGTADNGLPLYLFRYNEWDAPEQLGLMADDVAEVRPDAVITRPDGMQMVDYAKALK